MSMNLQDGSRPTVVLVHGAFADGSSWNHVIERLQADGVQVTAPAIPLRGISIDSAYIASLFDQILGPVVAVGHSYGGAMITNAATNADNVVGLVYVCAFAPDEGEPLGEIASDSKDSVLSTAQVPLQYPTGEGQQRLQRLGRDVASHDGLGAAALRGTPRPDGAYGSGFRRPAGQPQPAGLQGFDRSARDRGQWRRAAARTGATDQSRRVHPWLPRGGGRAASGATAGRARTKWDVRRTTEVPVASRGVQPLPAGACSDEARAGAARGEAGGALA
jgi:pimeloyl-ACP methyl ester carboxylesterase